MKFDEIDAQTVFESFFEFYEKNKRYFIIIDDKQQEIGLLGVKQLFKTLKEYAEVSIHIFEKYRYHRQYRKLLKCLLELPFLLNFNCVFLHTEKESVRTLLKNAKKLGVFPLENTNETWFYRKKNESYA